MRQLRAVLAIAFLSTVVCAAAHGQPRAEHGLHYTDPARVWDEALPLGNGLLGALVWGDGKPLRISLDRTDLWDLRPVPEFHTEEYSYATMRQWVREGRIKDLHRLYDQPYGHPGPTKIPAGRIELTLLTAPSRIPRWIWPKRSLGCDSPTAARSASSCMPPSPWG